jgi:IgA Peptidase M64.
MINTLPPERLRIDLIFAGNSKSQNVYLDNLKKESQWSGSKTNLVDTFNYGEYLLEIKELIKSGNEDIAGNTIYSKGFNTLFQEWRTTAEASELSKAFNSSYLIPYPKSPILLIIHERVKETGKFKPLFQAKIDPTDKLISREIENQYKLDTLLFNGPIENKVDILFVADGYTASEMEKFRSDAQKMTDYMFTLEPYKSRRNDFNVWAIESISEDSGPDIPHEDIWKNTAANSNFYTFRSDRYLTAQNQQLVCKLASNAPYDALYVLVNTPKYGGGGIYNFYGLCASDAKFNLEVFIHELGHSFAGLGDEYYDSSTSYEDFYNLKTEPWEPNITTLVNFDVKWKDMLKEGTAIPTPITSIESDELGVYEGGGYMAKGIYRPRIDCRMKTNTAKDFCPVCQRAIQKMIDYYCK